MQKGLTQKVSPFCYWAKLISRTMRFIPAYLSKTHIT